MNKMLIMMCLLLVGCTGYQSYSTETPIEIMASKVDIKITDIDILPDNMVFHWKCFVSNKSNRGVSMTLEVQWFVDGQYLCSNKIDFYLNGQQSRMIEGPPITSKPFSKVEGMASIIKRVYDK